MCAGVRYVSYYTPCCHSVAICSASLTPRVILLLDPRRNVNFIRDILFDAGDMPEAGEELVAPDKEKAEPRPNLNPEFLSCLLQPPITHNSPNYTGIRRLLLHRKAVSSPAIDRRQVLLSFVRDIEIRFVAVLSVKLVKFRGIVTEYGIRVVRSGDAMGEDTSHIATLFEGLRTWRMLPASQAVLAIGSH